MIGFIICVTLPNFLYDGFEQLLELSINFEKTPRGLRKKKIIILSPNAREVITIKGANIISMSVLRTLKCFKRYNIDESSMPNPNTIIPDNTFIFC